ncbi:MAG: helix-turn-helix domain-containing protein [Verrucomicrobia bacterium]|nr:helix-turn-helix domain-containing protein [Verrucomicrobiota bacterium]
MKAIRKFRFDPDYAVPPGATLEETMEALGMTQRDLADRTGLTVQTLNRIFKGEQPISYETANKLELVTGTPAALWNNLEAQYREQLSKIDQARQMADNIIWLKSIPVKELSERKVIPAETDKGLVVREVLRFYGVSSVESWHTVWDEPAAAARRSPFLKSSPGPTSAWLRLGQLEAREIECAPYDKKRFSENLRLIRALTTKHPKEFVPEMRRLCAEAGVALALVPEIKGAPWSGAAEWITPTKAMILVNLRGRSEDKFWFSFFHEAGHILHDSKKETFIDDGKSYRDKPEEKRADDFAADILIPDIHNPAIKAVRSAGDLQKIAARLGICPGIVVGRHQYLTQKWTNFNGLKTKFVWVKESE